MKGFINKVAAITGAGSGMGRELALQLAARGCHVALSDVNEEGLEKTVQRITAAGSGVRVTSQKLDVADRQAVFDWADAVVDEHGKVNLIFNNAGVALSATVEGMKIEDFEWLMNINFWGVVHGTQAFLPHLRASGEGHVANTSSLFGLLAVPTTSAYHASKFAVRGFTESLRQELDVMRCGVSATCVHPGGIKTAIARTARTDDSIRTLGMDPEVSSKQFEKNFITTAEKAARIIIRGVERDARRVLVGPDAVIAEKLSRFLPMSTARLTTYLVRKQSGAQAAGSGRKADRSA